MSTETHLNTYLRDVEAKYELVVKHLGEFKLAVDQLKSIYEQLAAGDVTQAAESAKTDVEEDVKQVESSSSNTKKK